MSRLILPLLVVLMACSAPTAPTTSAQPTSASPSSILTTSSSPPVTSTQPSPTTTLPEEAVALVVGDFGNGSSAEYGVAERMRSVAVERGARALLTTGDNFYTDDVERIWNRPFGWVEDLGMEVWAAWGNHDIQSASRREAVLEILDPPAHWYRTALGDARLLFLDANQARDPQQARWLFSQLAVSRDEPVVVLFHQPAFSCSFHGSTPAVVEDWVPLFGSFGVDLVLNGHDHNYQRFDEGGTTYVVTGGGGGGLYEVDDCPRGTEPPLVWNDSEHHFLVLTSSAGTMTVEAVAEDGSILDSFEVDPFGS